jgi:hypothetical protein
MAALLVLPVNVAAGQVIPEQVPGVVALADFFPTPLVLSLSILNSASRVRSLTLFRFG